MSSTYTPIFADFTNGADLAGCGRFSTSAAFLSTLVRDDTTSVSIRAQDQDESGNEIVFPAQTFDNTLDWSVGGTLRVDSHNAGDAREAWYYIGDPAGVNLNIGFEIDDTAGGRAWQMTVMLNGVTVATGTLAVATATSNTFSASYSGGTLNVYGSGTLILTCLVSMTGLASRMFFSIQNDVVFQGHLCAVTTMSMTVNGFMTFYGGGTDTTFPLNFTGMYYAELTGSGGNAGGATHDGGGGGGTGVWFDQTANVGAASIQVQVSGPGGGGQSTLVEPGVLALSGDDGAGGSAGGIAIGVVDELDGGNGAAVKGGGGGSGTAAAAGGNASGQTAGTGLGTGGAGSLLAKGKNGSAPGGGGGGGATADSKGAEGQVVIGPLIGNVLLVNRTITFTTPKNVTWPGGTIPFTLVGLTTVSPLSMTLSNGLGTLVFSFIPSGSLSLHYSTSGKTPLKTAAASDIGGTMNTVTSPTTKPGNRNRYSTERNRNLR